MAISLVILWIAAGWITAALHSGHLARPSLAKYGVQLIYAVAILAAFFFVAVFIAQTPIAFSEGAIDRSWVVIAVMAVQLLALFLGYWMKRRFFA